MSTLRVRRNPHFTLLSRIDSAFYINAEGSSGSLDKSVVANRYNRTGFGNQLWLACTPIYLALVDQITNTYHTATLSRMWQHEPNDVRSDMGEMVDAWRGRCDFFAHNGLTRQITGREAGNYEYDKRNRLLKLHKQGRLK